MVTDDDSRDDAPGMEAQQAQQARRMQATHHAPTRNIPLRPATPVPAVGAHPALERQCDAPACQMMTAVFVATRSGVIVHYCEAHTAWAMEQAKVEGWWRE